MGQIANLMIMDRLSGKLKHIIPSSSWTIDNDYLSPNLSTFVIPFKDLVGLGDFNPKPQWSMTLESYMELDFCNEHYIPLPSYDLVDKTSGQKVDTVPLVVNTTEVPHSDGLYLTNGSAGDSYITFDSHTWGPISIDPNNNDAKWLCFKVRCKKKTIFDPQIFVLNDKYTNWNGATVIHSNITVLNNDEWNWVWIDLQSNKNVTSNGNITAIRFDWSGSNNIANADMTVSWMGIYNALNPESDDANTGALVGNTNKPGSTDPSLYTWYNLNIPSEFNAAQALGNDIIDPSFSKDPGRKKIYQGDFVVAKLDSAVNNIEDKVYASGVSFLTANQKGSLEGGWMSYDDSYSKWKSNPNVFYLGKEKQVGGTNVIFCPTNSNHMTWTIPAGETVVVKYDIKTDANIKVGTFSGLCGMGVDRTGTIQNTSEDDNVTQVGANHYIVTYTHTFTDKITIYEPYQIQLGMIVDDSVSGSYINLSCISMEKLSGQKEYSSAIFAGLVDSFSDNTLQCRPWSSGVTDFDMYMQAHSSSKLGSDIKALYNQWGYGFNAGLHLPLHHTEYLYNSDINWSFVPDSTYDSVNNGKDAKVNLQNLLVSEFKSKGLVFEFLGLAGLGDGTYEFASKISIKDGMVNMTSWSNNDVNTINVFERPNNITDPNCVLISRTSPAVNKNNIVKYDIEVWYKDFDNAVTKTLSSNVFQPTKNTAYVLDTTQYDNTNSVEGTNAPTNQEIAASVLKAVSQPHEITFSFRMSPDKGNVYSQYGQEITKEPTEKLQTKWTQFLDIGQRIRIFYNNKYYDSIISGYALTSDNQFIAVSCGGVRTSLQAALDQNK